MGEPWINASFGPLSATLGLLLLGYYIVGEPLLGRWAFERLRRRRPSDPTALRAFYRLTLACLWSAAAVVLLIVAVDPGLDANEIGIAWPTIPDGVAGSLVLGSLIGITIGLVIGPVVARRRRTPTPVADAVALMLPSTRVERRWAAGVAVTAGIAEELVFRGLFMALGIGLFGLHPLVAAALVTVVFGVAHVYQGVAGVLGTAALGAFFVAVALATGSLLIPVVVHAAIDLRSLLLTPNRAPTT